MIPPTLNVCILDKTADSGKETIVHMCSGPQNEEAISGYGRHIEPQCPVHIHTHVKTFSVEKLKILF